MSRRPIYGAWHRARVLANYARTSSHTAAARAAGVSPGWAYGVLKRNSRIADQNCFTARTMLEARRLYVEERLSCRGVVARLRAAGVDPAPSQQTVFDYLRRAGVLRTKSQADVIQNGRRNGRDYEAIGPVARELARERRWSVHRIARELDISRNAVKRHLEAEDRCDAAEATRRAQWEADTPEARARRERRIQVMQLRIAGKKLREIVAAVGVSLPTVCTWLREDGLTRPPVRHRLADSIRRRRRRPKEVPDDRS